MMQTIVAAFDEPAAAQRAIDSLITGGFDRNAVHMQAGYSTGSTGKSNNVGMSGTTGMNSPTGAVGGSASMSTSPAQHQGFLAGVENFFSNLFGDDHDTTSTAQTGKYTEVVRRGSSVVAVDATSDTEAERATDILYEHGAINVDERASGWDQQGAVGTTGALDTEGQAVMPVVQEELQVGKRTVERGGIRVVKRMTETPVSQMVTLREERAVIERRPVDRAATDADFTNFKDGTIEVRERSEEAVVGKTARVVEEVVVGKQVSEREQTVSDTVRRTDVEVENLETVKGSTQPGSTTDMPKRY